MHKKLVEALGTGMAAIILVSLSIATGCESLGSTTTIVVTTTMEAPTTTEAPTASTTLGLVELTEETSQSPCYVRDAFSRDGKDYVVVDYIQVNWPSPEEAENGESFEIVNSNPKLRTFVVPPGVELSIDFEALVYGVECGDVNTAGEFTRWGFWDIRVVGGYVTSLESGSGPYVW